MRNALYVVVVIAALIVVYLHISKTNTVPNEARKALATPQSGEINRITQLPDAVRKKLDEEQKKAQGRIDDAMKNIEKYEK